MLCKCWQKLYKPNISHKLHKPIAKYIMSFYPDSEDSVQSQPVQNILQLSMNTCGFRQIKRKFSCHSAQICMFFSGVTSNVRKKHPLQLELFRASMSHYVSAQDSFCFVFSCYMIMNFNFLIAALKDGLHLSDITITIFLQSLKI